ncbi:sporulation related protein [Kushneria sinocarnis]|uniref:Sporulation related protein n=1 Tax=Kushneria sinocarnis TaxID=595502 RepID=A0A420WXF4_9GAMM|nr:SPOR domain-containing protein [Kushneria sinocarnis]RKR04408.1 sporulation related protein [Kushneria sinocarnis]
MAGGRSSSRNGSANQRGNGRGGATSKRNTTRNRQGGDGFHVPGWLWGIVGLIAGFAAAQYFHSSAPPQGREQVAAVVARQSGGNSESAQQQSSQEEQPSARQEKMPTFEFYTLLPESEVVAPSVDAYKSTPRPGTQAAADQKARQIMQNNNASGQNSASDTQGSDNADSGNTGTPSSYVLQAASFRSNDDARKMARKLKDLSLKARVSEVTTADGTHWYRVQVGPYQDTREISRARDLMETQQIEPMLIRLQG